MGTKEKEDDFETAISKTKFGLFNLLLLLVAIPSIFASQFELSALSYALPAAECDLNLTLGDKGLANAIIFIGMIGGCFVWGPLVDVFGRKRILIISHLLDSVFVLLAALSSNFIVLMVAKMMGGFIINGPCMALTPYLSEFHGTYVRSRIPLIVGLWYSVGQIMLPLLAWSSLPLEVSFKAFGTFEIHSWNLFLLVCSIPSIASGIFFIFMPETPKYLMSKGNNEEALKVFQKIFKINTRKPKHEYPVTKLIDDRQIHQKKRGIQEAWNQISPLFSPKFLPKLILVCILMMLLLMCATSLRLWLPEIFQVINDYQPGSNNTVSFCQIFNTMYNTAASEDETCSMNFDNSSVYINSIIVGAAQVLAYGGAGLCVNKVGKKRILVIFGIVSSLSAAAVYFSPNSSIAIFLICTHSICAWLCVDTVFIFTKDLFPTYLRATAISMALMCGRIGSVLGNLLFPLLIQAGCAPTFFVLGSIVIVCTTISVLLPNTDNKELD